MKGDFHTLFQSQKGENSTLLSGTYTPPPPPQRVEDWYANGNAKMVNKYFEPILGDAFNWKVCHVNLAITCPWK